MGGFGMGKVVEQLADLKLGELLDSPPPGFDEAVAISKVCVLHCFMASLPRVLFVLCTVYCSHLLALACYLHPCAFRSCRRCPMHAC